MRLAVLTPQSFSEYVALTCQAVPAGQEIYLVGGAVRDALLGVRSHDLDFVLPGNAPRLARRVADRLGGAFFLLDEARGTARVLLNAGTGFTVTLDFACLRGPTLAEDLRARDFTINAIAAPLAEPEALIDPLGGKADLAEGRLRACTSHSMEADPLRTVRAVRLAEALNLRIDKETLGWIREAAAGLGRVSAERRRDELFRILEGERPGRAVRRLFDLGAAGACFPAVPGEEFSLPALKSGVIELDTLADFRDSLTIEQPPRANWDSAFRHAWTHIRAFAPRIDAHLEACLVSPRPVRALLLLEMLYSRVLDSTSADTGTRVQPDRRGFRLGEEKIEPVGRALALSNLEIGRWQRFAWAREQIRHLASAGSSLTDLEIYRYFRGAGEGGIDAVLAALARMRRNPAESSTTQLIQVCSGLMEAWWEKPAELVSPPPLVSGDDLRSELGIPAGPRIGLMLEEIREAKVEGRLSSRDQALAWARERLREDESI